MTPVGHSLLGGTLAIAAAPRTAKSGTRLVLVAAFALLANVPDTRLSGWGHDRYAISHSIFVNLGLILLLALPFVFSPRARRMVGGIPLILCAALSWMSHLLLDSFYSHGRGVPIFGPVSSARLALPLPWFENLREPLPHFDLHSARVCGIECAFFGAVFALVCITRYLVEKHERTGQQRLGYGS